MMTHVSLPHQHLKQHPQQSSEHLSLVTSCLEQVMVNHQEINENIQDLEQRFASCLVQLRANCRETHEKQEKNLEQRFQRLTTSRFEQLNKTVGSHEFLARLDYY